MFEIQSKTELFTHLRIIEMGTPEIIFKCLFSELLFMIFLMTLLSNTVGVFFSKNSAEIDSVFSFSAKWEPIPDPNMPPFKEYLI